MTRDRALRQEERRSDLGVRPPLRDEVGDPPLGRGQTLDARPATDPPQLLASRARSAQRTASSFSKPAHAASIASRPGRFCRARRRTAPSASSARARPNASPTASCSDATASASSEQRLLDLPPRDGSDEPSAPCRVRRAPSRGRAGGRQPPTRRGGRPRPRRGRARAAPRSAPHATSTCSAQFRQACCSSPPRPRSGQRLPPDPRSRPRPLPASRSVR